jgi:uncharacterized membrane protein YgdD (TMEM256/DUF423 family)
MARFFVGVAGALGALGVAAGAFAAHGLRAHLAPRMLDVFETGARYQMYHALALLAVGLLLTRRSHPALTVAGWLFAAGVVLFSGSLYLLAVTGARWLGAITPAGGLAFIAGWLMLGWGGWRGEERTLSSEH